ncbi:MAG: nicotinate-nucleotide adenylyltransferase [Rubrivivax sp.]
MALRLGAGAGHARGAAVLGFSSPQGLGLKTVALFGGSFDPPHLAHLALARAALALADEVRWIPAGQPWQKARAMTPAADREAMVRLVIDGEPRFVLDRIELERKGPSYTLDTVQALARREPGTQWLLLIGADQYANLHTWRGWRELLARVTLAVAPRPGVAAEPDAAVAAHPHRTVPLPPMDLSATDIRARAAAGQPLTDLVPPEVARYIETRHLYRA